jgi:hypothetical protein
MGHFTLILIAGGGIVSGIAALVLRHQIAQLLAVQYRKTQAVGGSPTSATIVILACALLSMGAVSMVVWATAIR